MNKRLLTKEESAKIKADMIRKCIGRLEVSKSLGASYNSLAQWLNGFQPIPLDKLQALKRIIDLGELPDA